MQNPRNLRVALAAEELADAVYSYTARFPPDERFGLASQMRRAAISIGSNIYEGCGRQSNRALGAFLYIALGSASELEFQLRIAVRRHLGDDAEARRIQQRLIAVKRMLALLIKRLAPAIN